MAIYDFGLDATEDVARKLGIDVAGIGAATTPLKAADVDDALTAGCADAVARAYARGITANAALATSDEETHDKLKRLAQAKAVADLALAHGNLLEVYETWWNRYLMLAAELSGRPGEYGSGDPGISGISTRMDDVVTGDANEIGNWDWETTGKAF